MSVAGSQAVSQQVDKEIIGGKSQGDGMLYRRRPEVQARREFPAHMQIQQEE